MSYYDGVGEPTLTSMRRMDDDTTALETQQQQDHHNNNTQLQQQQQEEGDNDDSNNDDVLLLSSIREVTDVNIAVNSRSRSEVTTVTTTRTTVTSVVREEYSPPPHAPPNPHLQYDHDTHNPTSPHQPHHDSDSSNNNNTNPNNNNNDSRSDVGGSTPNGREPTPTITTTPPASSSSNVMHTRSEGRCKSVQVMDLDPAGFSGPGPARDFPYDRLFRCFHVERGILFRLVDDRRHRWAYYNDTHTYAVRVCVTFGPESVVKPLGAAQCTMLGDAATGGRCRVEAIVAPGQTMWFMQGEYNGFSSTYTAVLATTTSSNSAKTTPVRTARTTARSSATEEAGSLRGSSLLNGGGE